jgi:hypothetical protein
VGRQALEEAVGNFRDRPQLTRLRTHPQRRGPDDAFSQVPYEKGYLFLRAVEDVVGRPAFDGFLRRYMDRFRFQSITTGSCSTSSASSFPGRWKRSTLAAVDRRRGHPRLGARWPGATRLARVQVAGDGSAHDRRAGAGSPWSGPSH